jgi:hypothetical protein
LLALVLAAGAGALLSLDVLTSALSISASSSAISVKSWVVIPASSIAYRSINNNGGGGGE